MTKSKIFLGQHFLRCRWVISTLIKAAEITQDDTVLEIGPGTGILTRELARYAGQVIAAEKDETLAERLREEKIPNVTVITGDILRLLSKSDFDGRLKSDFNHNEYKVVANIPYYLTSRLFRILLESGPRPERIVVTIQKEVAERLTARPPKMNLLALSGQIFGKPEIIQKVPRECFSPPPQVESAVIKISDISDIRLKKAGITAEQFFQTAKIVFASPRKTILNNLARAVGKDGALNILKCARLDPSGRAETLEAEDILRLAKAIR